MAIGVSATRRENDVFYAQVQLSGGAVDCVLEVNAATTDGTKLPACALKGDEEGEWYLLLPGFSVTQVVTLTARSAEGEQVEKLTQKLNPIATRLPSPTGAFKRRTHAPEQAPAARGTFGEWEIVIDRLVATRDSLDVCQGHAVLVRQGRSSVEGGVEVCALDARGQSVLPGAWTCLSDRITPSAIHGDFYERRIEFSVRVPSSVTMMVLWVNPQGGTSLPTGFACFGSRLMAGMRTVWKDGATSAHNDETYGEWFTSLHAATQAELSMQRASRGEGPLFSVVSVLHDATPEVLREMVDSMLEQSYERFELVLVNAAPDNRRLASAVRSVELADARVRCVPLAVDFGTAAATSEGIDASTGEFVCLLGEGDLFAPDALWCLAAELAVHPEADVLYTDEDRIEHGHHTKPRFKPSWDPDLLLGANYVGNLLAIRARLLHGLETMGRELDGAEGYNLLLSAIRSTREVRHIPRVLYHAQSHRGKKDKAGDTASFASGLLAVREYLAATGQRATVRASTRVPYGYELSYELPADAPLVSVIVVNRDGVAELTRCISALRDRTEYQNFEVVIVEHESVQSETFDYYRQLEEADPRVRTIFYQGEDASNMARLVNFGASRARGAYLVLLSPEVEVTDGAWMERLVSLCARDETGAVGARLLYADGTIAFTGGVLSPFGPVALDRYRLAGDCAQEPGALLHAVTLASGACLAVDAAAFRKVGGMSVSFAGSMNDADLCLRLIRRGYRVLIDPQVVLAYHRALLDDAIDEMSVEGLRAVGHLWDVWPYGNDVVDPTIGPNIDPHSAYHNLRL